MSSIKRLFALSALGALVLTGCLRYEGDVSVNPSGSLTGTLEFGIEKSIAPLLGVNSVEDLRASAAEGNSNTFCSTETAVIRDEPTEYVISCSFTDATPSSEDEIQAQRDGDNLVFRFTYNLDSEASTNPDQEYGSLRVQINTPGPIASIDDQGRGQVTQQGTNSFVIAGKASQIYDVTVVSICDASCSLVQSTSSDSPDTSGFTRANKRMGGVISKNTVFKSSKTPYEITKTIQIPEGVTVVVEPGSTLIWKGSRTKTSMFQNIGTLIIQGTKKAPILLTGQPRGYFNTKGAKPQTSTVVKYAILDGGGAIAGSLGGGGSSSGGAFSLKISDSVIRNMENAWYVWYPKGPFTFERNHLINSAGLSIGFDARQDPSRRVVIRDNLFRGPKANNDSGWNRAWIEIWAAYGGQVDIVSNDFSKAGGTVILDKSEPGAVNASSNYWGTTSAAKIGKKIKDGADKFPPREGVVISSPLKSRPKSVPSVPQRWS